MPKHLSSLGAGSNLAYASRSLGELTANGVAATDSKAYDAAFSISASGYIGTGSASGAKGLSEPKDGKFDRMVGYVQSYSATDGWGVLRSRELDGEITFHADEIMPEFQSHRFATSEPVEFTIQVDEQGVRVATLVKPKLGRTAYEAVGIRCRGYVRRFAERWGFLNAASFDGDLFVHRDNVLPASDFPGEVREPLLATGQVVEFDIMLDDRLRVVAKMITTCIPSQPGDWVGQRINGYVRSFQDRWGFLNSERFVGDLFVHRDGMLPQYQGINLLPGTLVEFDVRHDDHRPDSKNRLVARNVAVLSIPQNEMGTNEQTLTGFGQPTGSSLPSHPMQPLRQAPMQMPMQVASMQQSQAHLLGQPAPMHPQPMQPMPQPMQQASTLATNPYYAAHATAYPAQPQISQQVYPQQYDAYQNPGFTQQVVMPHVGQPTGYVEAVGTPQPQTFAEVAPAVTGMEVYAQSQAYVMPITQQVLPYNIQQVAEQPYQVTNQATLYPAVSTSMQPFGTATAPSSAPPQMAVMPQIAAPMTDGHMAVDASKLVRQSDFQAYQMQLPGLLHMAVQDWEPDATDVRGQMHLQAGVLVGVTQEAQHGWVYGTQPARPSRGNGGMPIDGWIPKAMLKRVMLCQVLADWMADSQGTLSVRKGDLVAVSHEAVRGWIYGERCWGFGEPTPGVMLQAGWLPKKVTDVVQS